MEVDSHCRVVRLLKEVPPVAGKNLHLNLSLHLQQFIESLLQRQPPAAVVVDPRHRRVPAQVPRPTY